MLMRSTKKFMDFKIGKSGNNVLIFILGSLLFAGSLSCKKTVENKQQDYIMNLITDGRWYMYEFTETQVDVTSDFYGYEFQFYENGSVDCFIGNSKQTGTWTPDITNYTISANFPSATNPLQKINNVWKIVDSYTNAVTAISTTGAVAYRMTLVKK